MREQRKAFVHAAVPPVPPVPSRKQGVGQRNEKNGAGSQKPGAAMSDADILAALDGWLGDGQAPPVNNVTFAVLADALQAASNDATTAVTKPVSTETAPGATTDAKVSRNASRTKFTQAFMAKGIAAQSADMLARSLMQRDRQLDDRRSCAECKSFHKGQCLQRITPIGETSIYTLHRCRGFELNEVLHD